MPYRKNHWKNTDQFDELGISQVKSQGTCVLFSDSKAKLT